MRVLKYTFTILLLASALAVSGFAQAVREDIFFLNEDGMRAVHYWTTRTDYNSYNVFVGKDKAVDDFYYASPNNFTFDTTGDEKSNVFRFASGSYAMMEEADLSELVTAGESGEMVLSFNKASRENRRGFWNTPNDFERFAFSIVVPANIEVVSQECNRPGEWVKRKNTLTYFGANVNDVVPTIRYRKRSAAAYTALQSSLGGNAAVSLTQLDAGVRLIVGDAILFNSGSAELTGEGKLLLAKIVSSLKGQPGRIAIEGHTDNVPISGELKNQFASNWELSSARALAVLHELAAAGLGEERLESRAFGSTRPRGPNDSAGSRAKNRRIELILLDGGQQE